MKMNEAILRNKKILICDDDEDLLDTLNFCLSDQGYETSIASDAASLFERLDIENYDLLLLDLELGKDNGLEIALQIRKTSHIPIIMLTGRDNDMDKIVGLQIGADDYITKPYNTMELLARISSVLRRSSICQTMIPKQTTVGIIQFGPYTLNQDERKLFNGKVEVKLTFGEYNILEILVKNAHNTLSRDRILDLMGKENTTDRSIDIQIMRLRKKMNLNADNDSYIRAIRSVGYVFCAEISKQSK